MRGSILHLMVLFPLLLPAQQTLSKKEKREQRKLEKLWEQHQEVVLAVKDTTFSFFPYKITSGTKIGDDAGMFTVKKNSVTFINVYLPGVSNDPYERIASHYTTLEQFATQQEPTTEDVVTSFGFSYQNVAYTFIFEKAKSQQWAIGKLYKRAVLIGTYEGALKP